MIDKILVPLDGSDLSDRILTQVRRILTRADARVLLLRVLGPEPRDGNPGEQADRVDAARLHLDRLTRAIAAEGGNATSEIVVGADPAHRILEFAKGWRPSLVTMATHGRSGIARWIRGSIAERVVRESPFPLLLANPFAVPEGDPLRFRRILVPVDGSEAALEVFPLVETLARQFESEVVLFHAIEVPAVEYPVNLLVTTETDAREMLEGYRPRFEGLRVRLSTGFGSPGFAILEAAQAEQVDLLALTTHGRTGIERWAFGSVAEHVIRHASCPLLVQRVSAKGPAS